MAQPTHERDSAMHPLSQRFSLLAFLRWLALVVILASSISPALAAKTYTDNGNGTVTDPTTGLVWMRRSMGQAWNGSMRLATEMPKPMPSTESTRCPARLHLRITVIVRIPNTLELHTPVV